MRRAALYARVSTERQEKEETIESQLAAITRHADRQGLRHTPALTYTDDGHSGTWLDRPALDELRDHAREGRFDVVVVLCPDRLARRYAYQVLLLEELKRLGIEVLFCERPINDSPDDQLLLQVQGAIAEYERAKMLERCRRGRLHRARQGVLAPPRTPYGHGADSRLCRDIPRAFRLWLLVWIFIMNKTKERGSGKPLPLRDEETAASRLRGESWIPTTALTIRSREAVESPRGTTIRPNGASWCRRETHEFAKAWRGSPQDRAIDDVDYASPAPEAIEAELASKPPNGGKSTAGTPDIEIRLAGRSE